MLPQERAGLVGLVSMFAAVLCTLTVSVLGEVTEGVEVRSRCGAALKEVWGPLQTLVLVWRAQPQLPHRYRVGLDQSSPR